MNKVLVGDELFEAVDDWEGCRGCAFLTSSKYDDACKNNPCEPDERTDGRHIIYIKVKNA